ncbi:Acts in the nervous system to mediate the control of copulatory organs during courtship, partial [Tyrophagus putrescentiae]
PTAEQMRIASLMSSDKKDAENDLKPKIEQIVELTGASREDAAVALYDCDNDMTKAIEMILDGDALDSEWQSTGRKKKTKAQALAAGQLQTAALLDPSALTNGSKKGEKGGRGGAGGQKNSLSNNNGGAPNRDASSGGPKGGPRGERGERSGGPPGASSANANSRSPRKREPRASGGGGDGFKGAEAGATNNTTTEENDIFAKASSAAANLPGGGAGVGGGGGDSAARRGGRRGGPRGGGRGGIGGGLPRGAPRGGPGGPGDRGVGGGGGERGGGERSGGERGGRGTRTFMNRGLNNSQGGAGGVGGVEARTGNLASGPAGPNDGGAGFPNSIETWTNSSVQDQQAAASGKPTDDQMNQIGNWSDIVVNEDWSEEDWTAQPMETKVFTPSTKTIAEKDEPAAPLNHHNTSASQLSFHCKEQC